MLSDVSYLLAHSSFSVHALVQMFRHGIDGTVHVCVDWLSIRDYFFPPFFFFFFDDDEADVVAAAAAPASPPACPAAAPLVPLASFACPCPCAAAAAAACASTPTASSSMASCAAAPAAAAAGSRPAMAPVSSRVKASKRLRIIDERVRYFRHWHAHAARQCKASLKDQLEARTHGVVIGDFEDEPRGRGARLDQVACLGSVCVTVSGRVGDTKTKRRHTLAGERLCRSRHCAWNDGQRLMYTIAALFSRSLRVFLPILYTTNER